MQRRCRRTRLISLTITHRHCLYSTDSQNAYEEFDILSSAREFTLGRGPLAELFLFLSKPTLIEGGDDSTISRIYRSNHDEQTAAESSFYDAYTRIRGDLISAITSWSPIRKLFSTQKVKLSALHNDCWDPDTIYFLLRRSSRQASSLRNA
jgi:hypothetical protein